MSNNWVIQNLQNSLTTWNSNLTEIWKLLTQSPESFKGGKIWEVILSIHGALQAIGYSLLVLFFVIGVIKTCGSFAEIKKPEHAVRLLIRFVLAKAVITYGLDLMVNLITIGQGISARIMVASGLNGTQQTIVPDTIIDSINNCGFWESIPLWAVTLIGSIFITILSFVMILSVYGRFFKIYMYSAIAPLPLSTFAGQPTENIGRQFLKGYCGVLLEGGIIVLACVIFSVFASSPPMVDSSVSAITQVWVYIGEIIFNMLVLVGSIKMADRIVKEIIGL